MQSRHYFTSLNKYVYSFGNTYSIRNPNEPGPTSIVVRIVLCDMREVDSLKIGN